MRATAAGKYRLKCTSQDDDRGGESNSAAEGSVKRIEGNLFRVMSAIRRENGIIRDI